MLRSLLNKASAKHSLHLAQLNWQRGMHTRNKKAMELIAKGWSALKEVDRVIDYCELNDKRLIPLLRVYPGFEYALLHLRNEYWLGVKTSVLELYGYNPHTKIRSKSVDLPLEVYVDDKSGWSSCLCTAKENFELALETDNSNTHARFWLSKLHLKYHVPGACKAIGAALLVEAADMGDADAQYELACRLRLENDYVQEDQQAFHYLEMAVDQLHPAALYMLGAVYLTGDCVKKDISSAIWCFHRASEKGHAGAAIAYGSLLLRGVQVPECLTKFNAKRDSSTRLPRKNAGNSTQNPLEMAREQFEIAAKAKCDLGFRWLKRLEEEEKRLTNP